MVIKQIICAAIKLPDGYIIRGHRHNDCFRTLKNISKYKVISDLVIIQGFMTSENQFVGRYEALDIQQDAGIASNNPVGYIGNQLYSEDLY